MNIKTIRTLVGISVLVACAYAVFVYFTANAEAHAIVKTCSKEQDHAACYERIVPGLYPKYSVGELFNLVNKIRTLDPSYQFCHVLAHKIGERVVADDPSRWVDEIPLNPPMGTCSNGFIHGVIGGRFRAEVLDDATLNSERSDFARACAPRASWQPSDLDRAICYHGMGHLFDFITNANLTKALSLCESTAPSEYLRVCTEGVFMQIYQPLEPDDFLMIEQMKVKPSKETYRTFCASFTNSVPVGACLHEAWPYYRDDILQGNVSSFCSGQPNPTETDRCYETVSSIIGRMSLDDPSRGAAACARMESTRQPGCYSAVAQAFLEENRADGTDAVALCRRAPSSIAESCFETLAQRARFVFGGSNARTPFCTLLPESYRELCMSE